MAFLSVIPRFCRNSTVFVSLVLHPLQISLFSFGLTGKGTYASQSGHDDVAMTVVNLSALFDGNAFFDLISEIYDELDEGYKELIESKLDDTDPEGGTKEGGFYGSFSKLL